MLAKVYYILHGDVFGNYTITTANEITVDNIVNIIQQAKRYHDLPGKQFTVVSPNKTFHVVKVNKVWKSYELVPPKEEEHAEH